MLKKNSFKNVDIAKKLFKVFLKIIRILFLVNIKIENVNTSSCVLYILKIKGYDNTLSLENLKIDYFSRTLMYLIVRIDIIHICIVWSLMIKQKYEYSPDIFVWVGP